MSRRRARPAWARHSRFRRSNVRRPAAISSDPMGRAASGPSPSILASAREPIAAGGREERWDFSDSQSFGFDAMGIPRRAFSVEAREKPPIDWRRGLLRVWLLVSAAWLMGWMILSGHVRNSGRVRKRQAMSWSCRSCFSARRSHCFFSAWRRAWGHFAASRSRTTCWGNERAIRLNHPVTDIADKIFSTISCGGGSIETVRRFRPPPALQAPRTDCAAGLMA